MHITRADTQAYWADKDKGRRGWKWTCNVSKYRWSKNHLSIESWQGWLKDIVVIEKNKEKDSVIMMLKYKNMVTRKAIDIDSGNMETFVLVLILWLIHCMTLEKSPAFFLIQLSLLYALGKLLQCSVGYICMQSGSNIVGGKSKDCSQTD